MSSFRLEKVCNAWVATAVPSRLLPSAALGAITRYRRKHDGLWVGGKLVATEDSIAFTPNALNVAVHENVEPVHIPMRDVTSVRREFGWVTGIVVVTHRLGELRFRCFGARRLAATLASRANAL